MDDEVRALLAVWLEDDIQPELEGTMRNDVAASQARLGHERDAGECQYIMLLKQEYSWCSFS